MIVNVEYHLTIHDLPSRERPRERLRQYGAAADKQDISRRGRAYMACYLCNLLLAKPVERLPAA